MAKLCLVQTGQTTWEMDGRIESPNGSPLTEVGLKVAQVIACELVTEEIGVIYASDAEAEQQTAKTLAKELGVKIITDPDLRDMDYGLWQGLTIDEIKRRQPKLYKQWREQPAGACPPGGERPEDARRRLAKAVKAIVKRQKRKYVAVVARPLVIGLLRCLLTQTDLSKLWQVVDPTFTWCSCDMDDTALP